MSTNHKTSAVAVLVVLAAAGCGDRNSGLRSVSVDTLATGVIVVRNASPPSEGAEAWGLERVVRIGAQEGTEAATFGQVRDVAIGLAELVYVLDGQAREIRVFDLSGDHIHSFARMGSGPGELLAPYAIAFDTADNVWVADEALARYTVFDTRGNVIATFRRPIEWPVTMGVLRMSLDGTLHEHGWWGRGPGGAIRMSTAPEPSVMDTVSLPPFEVPLFSSQTRQGFGIPVPFSPRPVADVGPTGTVWTGTGHQYRLVQLTATGDTSRIIEFSLPSARLSDAELAAARDTADQAQARGFVVDRARIPATHPAYTSIIVSDDGYIWIRRAAGTQHRSLGEFVHDIFDPDGAYVTTVSAPLAEWPAPHVSSTYIAGVARDELGVDHVEVYRIMKR